VDERYSTERMLVLRKVTRAIANLLRAQLKEYLATMTPLLSPKSVFAHHIQSPVKETVRSADKAVKELQALYEPLAGSKVFNLPKEIQPPFEVISSVLEAYPLEYSYVTKTDRENKSITVISPLKWVLCYSDFTPRRLKELLSERSRSVEDLREFLVHALIMRVVAGHQTGVGQILEGLHFPISFDTLNELGGLPIACVSSSITTIRPPDDVLIQSTEISGSDAFEEVVNLEDIVKLRDPLKARLVELVESHGEKLLPT